MYCVLLEPISKPPVAALSIPISTLAVVGVDGFVIDPVRAMAPHVIACVVNDEVFNVKEGDKFQFTFILKSWFVVSKISLPF